MSRHENINSNDPLFLVSRDLDGDLSAAEKSRLAEVLAGSNKLQKDAEALRVVSSLVSGRVTDEAGVDWLHFEKLVMARVAEADENSTQVDQLLSRWAAREPVYNEGHYAGQVLTRIATAKKPNVSWRLVARLGAPLAAAAAVVIAVTATWHAPISMVNLAPVAVVEIGPSRLGPGDGVSIVSFSRSTERDVHFEETVSFGYMTLGASPSTQMEEAPL